MMDIMVKGHEDNECCEALITTLGIRDRLEEVCEPLQIIAIIERALQHIFAGEDAELHMENLKTKLKATDTLEAIRAQITLFYKEVCIPRDYSSWYQEALKELAVKISAYREAIEKLCTMPCTTPEERLNVRIVDKMDMLSSSLLARREYRATIDDPLAFAKWKKDKEGWLKKSIEDCDELGQLFTDNAPESAAKLVAENVAE